MLDTNICIYLINGNQALTEKIKKIGLYSIGISNTTLAELYFGAYFSENIEFNITNIAEFKKHLTVYPDSADSAKAFGGIKANLRRNGQMIEDFDILIASIALANDCVLVTNNIRHFERIDNLTIENWVGE